MTTTARRVAPNPPPVEPLTPRQERHLWLLLHELGLDIEDERVACYWGLLHLREWLPDLAQRRAAVRGCR